MFKKNFIIIFLLSLLIGWQLLRPGYYAMHDDLQVMRLYEMDRCFQNGQIPCRWAPDLGQNYGQPTFNYYSAFPYYLGELFHLVGFTFVDTVKLLFLFSLFFSGIFIYLLAREFLSENASLIAALAYMVAPYHAVDIFVRGALAESWGLALIPLVLYALSKTCRSPQVKYALLLALSLGAILTTHNITILISSPLIILFGLYFFWQNPNKKKQLTYLAPGIILGIGLSAFFLLPVLFERSFIQINFLTSDYFDFRAHFATLRQLFTKLSWGYGPSRFNSYQYPETLSFFVGLVPLLALILSPFALIKKRSALHLLLFLSTLLFLFMTHARSIFIWEIIPALSIVQFPWRFLGPVALLTSLLIGLNFDYLKSKFSDPRRPLAFLCAFLIAVNFSYFSFGKYLPHMTDKEKLTGDEYHNQIKGALLDYLPVGSQIPQNPAPATPQILNGIVDTNYFDKRSNYFSSEFDILSEQATVQFPVTYFPGWFVYQNRANQPIQFDTKNDFRQITLRLNKGHQLIQAFFENTPIRTLANLITFFSALITVAALAIF